MPSVAYEDYPEARLVIVWGINPSASGIHMIPYLREAQRRGAKLVVIDPRTTPLAKHADLHLALRPGTDLPVALAIHRHLFEGGFADRTFLDAHTRNAEQLREKAEPWTFERAAAEAGVVRGTRPHPRRLVRDDNPRTDSLRLGTGTQPQRRQFEHGDSGAARCRWEVRRPWWRLRHEQHRSLGHSAHLDRHAGASTRRINMNQLGRALTEGDPPVKVLFVYNSNAAATSPDQRRVLRGLEREDLFTVVFEQVMTDTTHYADVLLPATTFLEGYDMPRAYGPIGLRLGRPVIEAVGEARSNADVFGELLGLLGLSQEGDANGEIEEMLDVLAKMPPAVGDALREHGAAVPPHDGRPVQFVDVMPRTQRR